MFVFIMFVLCQSIRWRVNVNCVWIIVAYAVCAGGPPHLGLAEDKIPPEAIKEWAKYRKSPIRLLKLDGIDFGGLRSNTVYKARGSNRLVTVVEEKSAVLKKATAWVRNDRYSFRLSQRNQGEPWVVTLLALRWRGDDASEIDKYINAWEGEQGIYPITLVSYPIDELVKSKGFRVNSIKVDGERPELVWIDYSADANEEISPERTVFFLGGGLLSTQVMVGCQSVERLNTLAEANLFSDEPILGRKTNSGSGPATNLLCTRVTNSTLLTR